MRRRSFLGTCAAGVLQAREKETSPIDPHFPTAAHQLVWRNWDLAPVASIAEALHCRPEMVLGLAAAMRLGHPHIAGPYDSRLRFKALRRNWDFVPYDQLETLLGIDREQIGEMLSHDAFYSGHLGPKPDTPEIRVTAAPAAAAMTHFRGIVPVSSGQEETFAFIRELTTAPNEPRKARPAAFSPRIAFPYFAPYGDVLGKSDFAAYYPAGLLQRMADVGVNAIWLHAMLRDLAPPGVFPECGKESSARLERLNRVIAGARRYGLAVYLYLNEPMAMPDSFFTSRPEIQGAPGRPGDGLHSLCTSTAVVQEYLVQASAELFRHAPELEGVLLITASENPTNCYSLTRRPDCPRCAGRSGAVVIGEVVALIEKGIRSAKPAANVVAWDWSWGIVEDDPQSQIIAQLPRTVTLMVDFERGMPISRDGVSAQVDEYSLSTPGPSPRASAHIRQARERGMRVMAKAQVGTTWELGLLPFIPVPHLVARKFSAIRAAGVSGAMESWTLGSYPSLNWQVAERFYQAAAPDVDSAVREVARQRYGKEAADPVVAAWKIFAQAFEQYPFSNSLVYSSVVQNGPAQPWWLHPSGKTPRILNNYDDLHWTAPYGPDRVTRIFAAMAQQWRRGVDEFTAALRRVPAPRRPAALRDLRISRAVLLCFRSISNQVAFHSRRQTPGALPPLLQDEITIAEEFLQICRADSRIGFEASLEYFYLPLDLREKIASCRFILNELGAA